MRHEAMAQSQKESTQPTKSVSLLRILFILIAAGCGCLLVVLSIAVFILWWKYW